MGQKNSMLDFLREEGMEASLIEKLEEFQRLHPVDEQAAGRVLTPRYRYYGRQIWRQALTALLSGENLLLTGAKATGKNVLASNLAAAFGRPSWDISFYINTDASSLIGTDTFRDGQVVYREGPVTQCARLGGFGILDEINMAKNEALAVLHATLDFRRTIDIPGYDRIFLDESTRFIATMNYGYAGTRELNEALASRFVVIQMPEISKENLERLLKAEFPTLKDSWAGQLSQLFLELQKKCASSEISGRSLDLRGLLAAVRLMEQGLTSGEALELGLVNKCFDRYEEGLVRDAIRTRIPENLERRKLFSDEHDGSRV